jgi:hypothetical protein
LTALSQRTLRWGCEAISSAANSLEKYKKLLQGMVEQGQHDPDSLVVSALKHLVSLETDRPPLRGSDK